MKETIFSGFDMIDKDLGGLRPGEVTLIGGRPSMGKTSLALQIALNAARSGKNVSFFSYESNPVSLELRLATMISGIQSHKIHEWDMSDEEWDLLKVTMREIKKLPIHFFYTDTIQMIKLVCNDEAKKPDLIIFDYLQLIHYAFTETRDSTSELTSVDYLKEFKRIAKKHKAPVIVLSQLSRKLEKRKDKHPKIDDLRIEHLSDTDFDKAFLLYRDGYYDKDAPSDTAELTGVYPKKKLKETKIFRWDYEKGFLNQ